MSAKIAAIISATSKYYGVTLENEVLDLYVMDLDDLPEEAVLQAFGQYRRNPKNTRNPLPAQIRELVAPSVEPRQIAIDLTKKIIAALKKRGWTWPNMNTYAPHESFEAEFRSELGDLAWEVVQRNGGWKSVYDDWDVSDPTQFFAQLRDHVEAVVQLGRAGQLSNRPALSAPPVSLRIENFAGEG